MKFDDFKELGSETAVKVGSPQMVFFPTRITLFGLWYIVIHYDIHGNV